MKMRNTTSHGRCRHICDVLPFALSLSLRSNSDSFRMVFFSVLAVVAVHLSNKYRTVILRYLPHFIVSARANVIVYHLVGAKMLLGFGFKIRWYVCMASAKMWNTKIFHCCWHSMLPNWLVFARLHSEKFLSGAKQFPSDKFDEYI